jgi:uncharacterized protein
MRRIFSRILFVALVVTAYGLESGTESVRAAAPRGSAIAAAGEALYSQSIRISEYVKVRDGPLLAIDIYRPQADGKPLDEKLPVILVATPYHRSSENNGEILTFLASHGNHRNIFSEVLKHGYVIASLDVRGRGASFGTVYAGGMENDVNRWDLYDVIEWLAAQPWSDGNIGMGGCSYVGRTQLWAASAAPPHLKVIAPTGAPFDTYGLARVNGVTRDLLGKLDESMRTLDVESPAPAVDDDHGGTLRQAAIAEHRISWEKGLAGFTAARKARPFRNSPWPIPEFAYPAAAEWNYLPNYRMSKIPVLQYTGWRDLTLESDTTLYEALAGEGVTQKMIIGPWYHCEWDQSGLTDAAAQYLAWYDYWLKGIKNGVMAGPPIQYYVVGAPRGHEWQSANGWPLPNERPTTYFFRGKSTIGGDATLRLEKPSGTDEHKDDYLVDYTATAADLPTRFYWGIPNAINPGLIPIKTAALDFKSLTYTTAPLERDAELTGYSRMNLFVASTAHDQDFFIYLEELDEHGVSTLVTDGIIRASNRALRVPPFANGGLPWHPSLAQDQVDLTPGVPVNLNFVLHPISYYVRKGHRIRVTINNFDQGGNWDTPVITPAPTISIYRDARHPSSITLPFIVVPPTHPKST